MCTRYWMDRSPELRAIVEEMNRSSLVTKWEQQKMEIRTCGEAGPADVVPVICSNRAGKRAVFPMKWGFKGFSGKQLLLNARTETASVKPTFREAWESHRCIVPASWYFEWEHLTGRSGKKITGDKYRIRPKDAGMTWLCGLYRMEEGLPVFVVLTREPDEEIRFIHDRMPLMLPESLVNEWIRPDVRPEDLIGRAVTGMIFERAANE